MSQTYFLQIITPERSFFSGEVESLVVETSDGELGVLKGHVPLVAALAVGPLRVKRDGQWYEAAASEGFIEVRPDKTLVFAQTVEWPDEIDVRRAEQARERAQERVRQMHSMREYLVGKTSLARALVRLRVSSTKGSNRFD